MSVENKIQNFYSSIPPQFSKMTTQKCYTPRLPLELEYLIWEFYPVTTEHKEFMLKLCVLCKALDPIKALYPHFVDMRETESIPRILKRCNTHHVDRYVLWNFTDRFLCTYLEKDGDRENTCIYMYRIKGDDDTAHEIILNLPNMYRDFDPRSPYPL